MVFKGEQENGYFLLREKAFPKSSFVSVFSPRAAAKAKASFEGYCIYFRDYDIIKGKTFKVGEKKEQNFYPYCPKSFLFEFFNSNSWHTLRREICGLVASAFMCRIKVSWIFKRGQKS